MFCRGFSYAFGFMKSEEMPLVEQIISVFAEQILFLCGEDSCVGMCTGLLE